MNAPWDPASTTASSLRRNTDHAGSQTSIIMNTDARQTALHILDLHAKTGLLLDRVIDRESHRMQVLSQRDRALTTALVYGVLRWRNRLDWIISLFSKTRITKIEPTVLTILRLAVFQIEFMDRIPPSAAVNSAVDLAKKHSRPFVAKYVNAVLRQLLRNRDRVTDSSIPGTPAAALSIAKSFPRWLLQRWLDRFGREETGQLCDAVNRIPPVTLRANPLQTSRLELGNLLAAAVGEVRPTMYAPSGLQVTALSTAVHDLPGFDAGSFQVQDEAAQLVGHLLSPVPGSKVLDACAGLGGKTAHLAQLMENQGQVIALDQSQEKLTRLSDEMTRLRLTIVQTHCHNLKNPLGADGNDPYDSMLLDAPCSGLGVLRRNPDAKWNKSADDIRRCSRMQLQFLSNLAGRLKPGGVIVYAVCTNEPEENGAVIGAFLDRHADFSIDGLPDRFPPAAASLIDKNGFFNTYPHQNNMDGFFAARLRKNGRKSLRQT